MHVSYDTQVGVTYIKLHGGAVDHTISVSDLVMVDVDADGQALGVEFVMAPAEITDAMLDAAGGAFGDLKILGDRHTWLVSA